jgi:hypothetical protein
MSMDKAKVNDPRLAQENVVKNILDLLNEIKVITKDEFVYTNKNKKVNWSTVGSLNHVVELLKETKAFMLGKEVKDL